MSAATRRAALGAILAAPLASVPAAAAPPSDLARACHWAIQHTDWINEAASLDDWDDDRLNRECARSAKVFRRAIEEPSRSIADLSSKARLLLQDLENGGYADSEYADDRLIIVVLREVIELWA